MIANPITIWSLVCRWLTALAVLGMAFLAIAPASAMAQTENLAVVLNVKGAISPATADYLVRGLDKAQERGAAIIVIRMDTPGGLDTSMRDIIQAILSSPVPVATYVAPSGARAASAGTYILYASHVAAMTPGTNLGAATPVQIGAPTPFPGAREDDESDESDESEDGEDDKTSSEPEDEDKAKAPKRGGTPKDAMSAKAVNDAAAYIRGLAELRGRNAEWAEQAVREAASLSYHEALELNVIDIVADDVDDLLEQIDGRTVKVNHREQVLRTAGLPVEVLEPDWRTELLAIITNPNVAFLLLMVGVYGLIFEFSNPGSLVPGTIGAICLLLGFYALNILPVNYAGLALLILGIAFMVAEAFMPSFGVLGIGGVIAFIFGSTILFDTDVPGFGLSWPVIIGAAITSAAFFMIVLVMALRAHRQPVVSGREGMLGSLGKVMSWSGDGGRVVVLGEVWQAVAGQPLTPGQAVTVVEIQGLTLVVEPAKQQEITT